MMSTCLLHAREMGFSREPSGRLRMKSGARYTTRPVGEHFSRVTCFVVCLILEV